MKIKILDKSQIEAGIKSVAGRAKKLDNEIQSLCVSIHAHIVEHGDHTLATKLVAALSAGQRRNTLIAWFELTTWLVWDSQEKRFAKDKAKVMQPLDEAAKILWTEVQKEPEYRPFKAESALKTLAGKVKADREKGLPVDQELVKFMDGVRDLVGLDAYSESREEISRLQEQVKFLANQLADRTAELASAKQALGQQKLARRKKRA
ncbi:MAG: hypothetical protein WC340_18345 [Kiritimatiellia bacterium]